MRYDHDNDFDRDSSISVWAEEVRSGLVDEINPRRIAEIAAVTGTAVVASTTAASAAGAAVSQGGITMSISQAIASGGGLKLASGGLAAALALGGGAMAAGHLSTGHLFCETTVPTEVQGNLLVETGLDGQAQAAIETRIIEVEGLGLVDVAHSDVEVEVLGVQLQDGASAEVRSQNQGVAEVHFTLDGVVRTLLVSVVDGELFASMATTVSADASATGDAAIEAEADADAKVNADANVNADADVNADGALGIVIDSDSSIAGTVDADGEIDILTGVDVDADGAAGILGGLGSGGNISFLGVFGIDS